MEGLGVDEVAHADADPAHLVDEGGADAAEGGADGGRPAHLLVGAVDEEVVGHGDVGAVADVEVLYADAFRLEVFDLPEEVGGVDDEAVADEAGLVGVEDAGGDEVETERPHVVDNRVPGVVPRRVAGDDGCVLGQEVDGPTFSLVAPLAADDYECWHKFTPSWSGPASFLSLWTLGSGADALSNRRRV